MTMIVFPPHTETQSLLRIQTFMFLFFPAWSNPKPPLLFLLSSNDKFNSISEKNLKNSSELDNYCNQIES